MQAPEGSTKRGGRLLLVVALATPSLCYWWWRLMGMALVYPQAGARNRAESGISEATEVLVGLLVLSALSGGLATVLALSGRQRAVVCAVSVTPLLEWAIVFAAPWTAPA